MVGVCRSEKCEEFRSGNVDNDGVHDTCPLRAWESQLERVRVGKRERSLLFDDVCGLSRLSPTQPLEVVRRWLASRVRENLLVLAGSKGVGKTVAACYALSRFSRGRPTGRYILATEVVDPKVRIKRLAVHPLLVVDQVGLEYVSNPDWCDSRFTELVVRRDSDMLPTIFVGNLDEKAFRARYGTSVMDRVVGDGLFQVFRSPSLRSAR